jgi:hypothetical protein
MDIRRVALIYDDTSYNLGTTCFRSVRFREAKVAYRDSLRCRPGKEAAGSRPGRRP